MPKKGRKKKAPEPEPEPEEDVRPTPVRAEQGCVLRPILALC
eukprot:SAG22_NODE_518_length_9512_cov_5.735897_2_plen_42_part_00